LLERLQRTPILRDVATDQQSGGRRTDVAIDRDTAARMGITTQAVDDALDTAFGQRQVSTIFTQLNQYHVILELAPEYRRSPDALASVYVGTGGHVPLRAIANWTPASAPLVLNHQAQFPAVTLSFNLARGASLGEAVSTIETATREIGLPEAVRAEFQGTARAFQAALANEGALILAAIVTVYIVLGVLYESYIHPLTILSTLPSAGVGALAALMVAGQDLGIVALIGIVLLIGIVKKNAIMMIDFALVAERSRQAASAPAEARVLRSPIMMTMAAPAARLSPRAGLFAPPPGTTIVGGLLPSQSLTLFTTPVIT
jgi:multidrug efflux pump subunit AcrB